MKLFLLPAIVGALPFFLYLAITGLLWLGGM